MKQMLLISAILCAFSPIFGQKTTKKTTKTRQNATLELIEAVAKKWISIQSKSPGGARLVDLTLENTTQQSIRVKIPQGQLFMPADESEQTIVVREEETLVLLPKKSKSVQIKTFCTESSDASPSEITKFSVGLLASDQILKMLKFLLEKQKLDSSDAQSAIWSVADDRKFNPAGIGDREIVEAACQQINRKPPNYRVRYEIQDVPGQPSFSGKALVVDGNYEFYLEKAQKLTFRLFDANGKMIKELSKGKIFAAGGHKSGLHLEVKGLKQGIYKVKLVAEKGETVKEIEVEF
jgi:hypothetical protein